MNKLEQKIKFPEKITIGTKVFKVIHNKEEGGEFNWQTGVLRICDGKDYLSTLNLIFHEIFEMWSVALYLRYTRPDTFDCYEFHFDHKDFTNLCELSAKTISEFL